MDKLTVAEALARLADTGETYKRLLEKPDFDIGLYRPEAFDDQAPHARDEIYCIAAGTGMFVCDGEREECKPGDVFFVPAGIAHRFENVSEDFATWVIFIGARSLRA